MHIDLDLKGEDGVPAIIEVAKENVQGGGKRS